MAKVCRVLPFDPDTVFAVLVDPETYPNWLIGAREIRRVDVDWPAPGSCFHHKVGLGGPFEIADSTKVLDIDPPRCLSLEVRARPVGRGRATFILEPDTEPSASDGDGTRVEVDEVPLGWLKALAPLLEPVTRARNRRSLDLLSEHLVRSTPPRLPD